jgi:hydroxymethylbilane synthase
LIRIGTRGSALALVQASWVGERLGSDYELVRIEAVGSVEDKSRWVSSLEAALLAGEVDVAVHSAKDVPAELADGLELVAIPAREDPRDALVGSRALKDLRRGARVGTSSLRRAAQIRAARPDVDVVELRGNVDTRLRKLAEGQVDALVLAAAGLARLGRSGDAGGLLDEFVPAAGQGALALEARAGTIEPGRLAPVRDASATACVNVERALVHALGASCHTPVGAHARMDAWTSGGLIVTGWVGLPDGSAWLRDELVGDDESVGTRCAERMLAAGAAELLRQAEAEVAA